MLFAILVIHRQFAEHRRFSFDWTFPKQNAASTNQACATARGIVGTGVWALGDPSGKLCRNDRIQPFHDFSLDALKNLILH